MPKKVYNFFFNDTATTEIYTLSLHDALPIWIGFAGAALIDEQDVAVPAQLLIIRQGRSEEHTSELQSPDHLVCRLLLEKKKTPTDGTDNEAWSCRLFSGQP